MATREDAGVPLVRHADHALLGLLVRLGQVPQPVHLADEEAAVLDLALLRDHLDLGCSVDDACCAVNEDGLDSALFGRVERDDNDEGPLILHVDGVRVELFHADYGVVHLPAVEHEGVTLHAHMGWRSIPDSLELLSALFGDVRLRGGARKWIVCVLAHRRSPAQMDI